MHCFHGPVTNISARPRASSPSVDLTTTIPAHRRDAAVTTTETGCLPVTDVERACRAEQSAGWTEDLSVQETTVRSGVSCAYPTWLDLLPSLSLPPASYSAALADIPGLQVAQSPLCRRRQAAMQSLPRVPHRMRVPRTQRPAQASTHDLLLNHRRGYRRRTSARSATSEDRSSPAPTTPGRKRERGRDGAAAIQARRH